MRRAQEIFSVDLAEKLHQGGGIEHAELVRVFRGGWQEAVLKWLGLRAAAWGYSIYLGRPITSDTVRWLTLRIQRLEQASFRKVGWTW